MTTYPKLRQLVASVHLAIGEAWQFVLVKDRPNRLIVAFPMLARGEVAFDFEQRVAELLKPEVMIGAVPVCVVGPCWPAANGSPVPFSMMSRLALEDAMAYIERKVIEANHDRITALFLGMDPDDVSVFWGRWSRALNEEHARRAKVGEPEDPISNDAELESDAPLPQRFDPPWVTARRAGDPRPCRNCEIVVVPIEVSPQEVNLGLDGMCARCLEIRRAAREGRVPGNLARGSNSIAEAMRAMPLAAALSGAARAAASEPPDPNATCRRCGQALDPQRSCRGQCGACITAKLRL